MASSVKSTTSQRLGNLIQYQQTDLGILGETSQGKFRVQLYSDLIFRISITQEDFFDEFSYSVIASPAAKKFSLDDQSDSLTLTTSAMNSAPYRLEVSGVQDLAGNAMQTTVVKTFSGTDDPDNTRPELLSSEPVKDAHDVAIDTPIDLVFSEPILLSSLIAGTTWSSNLGNVEFTANTEDSLHVSLVPNSALAPDTRYTLDFDDVQDLSGNAMTSETLIFTTVDR